MSLRLFGQKIEYLVMEAKIHRLSFLWISRVSLLWVTRLLPTLPFMIQTGGLDIYHMSWSSIDDQTGLKTVLGPGKDGLFYINPEQHGERIGVQLSFIDSAGTFEQSEMFWSDKVVTGDSSGSNDTVFHIEFIGDVKTGSEVDFQFEASDVNGLSNPPSYSWRAGELSSNGDVLGYPIKIDGYYVKDNIPLKIPSEYFGQYLEVYVSVIDDLGNFYYEEFVYDTPILGQTPSFNQIDNINIEEDASATINLSQYLVDEDVDYGDAHRYELVSAQNFVTIDAETGLLTFSPKDEHVGANEIIFKATDSQGLSAEQTLNVSVSNTNDVPELTISHQEKGYVGISYSSLVQVDDDDKDSGDIIQVQIEGPDWLDYDPVNNLVKGTPPTTGSFEYTVIATDSFGASVRKTNQINVSDKFFSIDSFELVSFKSELTHSIIGSWPTNNPSDYGDFLNAEVLFIKVTGFAADGMDACSSLLSAS